MEAAIGLSEEDRALLSRIPRTIRSFSDRETIARVGDRPSHCTLLVEGFVMRQKVVGGKNQILAFYVPGDAPDLHTLQLPLMDHDLISAGPITVAYISHADIRTMLDYSRGLRNAFWRETLIDAAIYREWIANLARDAVGRLGHLVCELAARLDNVGLVEDGVYRVPFTQENLADASGLSTVHVNRTLQELRRSGLIKWQRQTFTLLKREELEQVADFQPDYLHQGDGQAISELKH